MSTSTLIFCPTTSSSICSSYRTPSSYIGLRTTRPSTAVEAEVMKGKKKGRRVVRVDGQVVGNDRMEDLMKEITKLEAEAEAEANGLPPPPPTPDTPTTAPTTTPSASSKKQKPKPRSVRHNETLYITKRREARLKYLHSLQAELACRGGATAPDADGASGGVPGAARGADLAARGADLAALGALDEYDQHRQVPLLLPDFARPNLVARKDCEAMDAGPYVDRVNEAINEVLTLRQEERNLRDIPYTIVAEQWTRMHPEHAAATLEALQSLSAVPTTPPPLSDSITLPFSHVPSTALLCVHSDLRRLGFHVACGAKFGSDFLIYDGDRENRHAFAGVRVYESLTVNAYDLTGFVRALNTAGKIAVCAFVEGGRVAYVDCVLEKILSSETHRKWKRTEKRKDMTINLSKEGDMKSKLEEKVVTVSEKRQKVYDSTPS